MENSIANETAVDRGTSRCWFPCRGDHKHLCQRKTSPARRQNASSPRVTPCHNPKIAQSFWKASLRMAAIPCVFINVCWASLTQWRSLKDSALNICICDLSSLAGRVVGTYRNDQVPVPGVSHCSGHARPMCTFLTNIGTDDPPAGGRPDSCVSRNIGVKARL